VHKPCDPQAEAERYLEAAGNIIIEHAEWIHGHMSRRSPRLRYQTAEGTLTVDYLMMFAMLRYNGFNIFLYHHKGMAGAMKGARRLLGKSRADAMVQEDLANLRKVCSYHYKRLDAEQRRDLARRLRYIRKLHREQPEADLVQVNQPDLRGGGEEVMIHADNLQEYQRYMRYLRDGKGSI
jgi:hypothetical protein